MRAKICVHCLVTGRVQGVWFRANTRIEAQKLGLTGWVRNISTGQVEILACGPEDKIELFHHWLHQGPPLAQVKEVVYEEVPIQKHIDFTVI